MARLAAADEIASQVADEGVNAGEKQRSKRKLISLVDSEEDSDVEITPTTQTTKPRRQTSFGTASHKPMIQSTLEVGSGSSKQACSQKKYVPVQSVIRGGRRNKGLSKGSGSQSQKKKKKIEEEIPELDNELDEEALVGVKIGHERNRCPKVLRKTESRSKFQKPRKQISETDRPASSTMTRASSPGEHGRVAADRLAGELDRGKANSPWTIPNPVSSHNHASSSEVSVTQSSVPWIRHQCSV
ncbi:hypothetical protein F2Q70_00017773 [Brassica cretica]|uniref:Uncharacterized protein n=1 Tax=Brassica cretica TaxID=69181 RepID=A0A8S9HNZ1_BRACR|nr:hypothetical protein F2Q70_00017773 [Brassica cretica]